MADSWKIYIAFSTDDGRLRLSLQAPIEEPQSFFLDIRRCFEKDGKFLCTRRGIRITTSNEQLGELLTSLQDILRGTETQLTSAGLRLSRRSGKLRIRKATPFEGETPVFIILNLSEAAFLQTKLVTIQQTVAAYQDESDNESVEDEL